MTHSSPIRKFLFLSIALLFFSACSLDPDPEYQLPDPIRSYFILYNYLAEPYHLEWEVEGYALSVVHEYGGTILGFVNLDSAANDITFSAFRHYSSTRIQTVTYRMEENNYYMLAIMGREDSAHILCKPMDLESPASGMIKLCMIHASMAHDSLDIYVGGGSADQRIISGITYKEASGYLEVWPDDLSDSVVVSPHGSAPGIDTVLVSMTNPGIFHQDRIYLGVIGHPDPSDTTSLNLVFYDQPQY